MKKLLVTASRHIFTQYTPREKYPYGLKKVQSEKTSMSAYYYNESGEREVLFANSHKETVLNLSTAVAYAEEIKHNFLAQSGLREVGFSYSEDPNTTEDSYRCSFIYLLEESDESETSGSTEGGTIDT